VLDLFEPSLGYSKIEAYKHAVAFLQFFELFCLGQKAIEAYMGFSVSVKRQPSL